MKRIVLLIAVAAALMLGGLAAAGLAAPPVDNPGSPGDNCSMGNSNQPCVPDPSTNGQDCDDHGRARGNENHCDATETTTTETTTTEETVTTSTPEPSSSDPPTTTETVSGTTPSVSPSDPASGSSSQTPSASVAPGASNHLPTRHSLEEALEKQAPKVTGATSSTPTARADELPYTGLPLGVWVALGFSLVGTGLYLRRLA